jgi:4-amino-4-deoxy-L-arabinose transferase-like glycosyltransferase
VNAVTLKPGDVRALHWNEALGSVAVHYFWQCFAAVLALTAGNVFWRLGDTVVRDCDEGRYAVAASEMLHAHSMLVTTYAGETEFWNLKPPLGYWLLDLSYWVMGETPLALRIPAAICGLAATALTMLITRRIAGARAAILAGIVLATSFGFLAHHGARGGELDSPLTLLMLLFLMLAPRLADARPARLAAGLVLALAFLLKSFGHRS